MRFSFSPRLAPSIICFLAPSLPITPIYSPTLLYRATFLRTVVSCLNTEGAKNNKQPKKKASAKLCSVLGTAPRSLRLSAASSVDSLGGEDSLTQLQATRIGRASRSHLCLGRPAEEYRVHDAEYYSSRGGKGEGRTVSRVGTLCRVLQLDTRD